MSYNAKASASHSCFVDQRLNVGTQKNPLASYGFSHQFPPKTFLFHGYPCQFSPLVTTRRAFNRRCAWKSFTSAEPGSQRIWVFTTCDWPAPYNRYNTSLPLTCWVNQTLTPPQKKGVVFCLFVLKDLGFVFQGMGILAWSWALNQEYPLITSDSAM